MSIEPIAALSSQRPTRRRRAFALGVAALGLSLPAAANSNGTTAPTTPTTTELIVRVKGIAEPLGQIGCSLFAQEAGFPMDNRQARVTWLTADAQGVMCRYTDVPEGRYAVSVGHDLNGNRRVDTNFVGLPTEQWGVSNNVRPRLRAPRFDEAVFTVPAGTSQRIVDIQVAR